MNKVEQLMKELLALVEDKKSKHLNFKVMEKLIQRTAEYADGCISCQHNLEMLHAYLQELKAANEDDNFTAINRRKHREKMNLITTHLKNEHNLITDDHYTGIYMSFGMSLGLIIGLSLDNIAIGIAIGMCIGLSIGAAKDADAKKNGKVI